MAEKEYVRFRLKPRRPETVTDRWDVLTVAGELQLGVVAWYAPWRRYTFTPRPHYTLTFDADSLDAISSYCRTETTRRREVREAQSATE